MATSVWPSELVGAEVRMCPWFIRMAHEQALQWGVPASAAEVWLRRVASERKGWARVVAFEFMLNVYADKGLVWVTEGVAGVRTPVPEWLGYGVRFELNANFETARGGCWGSWYDLGSLGDFAARVFSWRRWIEYEARAERDTLRDFVRELGVREYLEFKMRMSLNEFRGVEMVVVRVETETGTEHDIEGGYVVKFDDPNPLCRSVRRVTEAVDWRCRVEYTKEDFTQVEMLPYGVLTWPLHMAEEFDLEVEIPVSIFGARSVVS